MCDGHWWLIPDLAEKTNEEGHGVAEGHCRHCADTRWFLISHVSHGAWEEQGNRHIMYPRQSLRTLAEERTGRSA
jgi:hypothetical protein